MNNQTIDLTLTYAQAVALHDTIAFLETNTDVHPLVTQVDHALFNAINNINGQKTVYCYTDKTLITLWLTFGPRCKIPLGREMEPFGDCTIQIYSHQLHDPAYKNSPLHDLISDHSCCYPARLKDGTLEIYNGEFIIELDKAQ